jgi:RimJ/RimL family protein N-acetyltransferase
VTVTLRALEERDLATLFEIQREPEGQRMAAFIDPRTSDDVEAYRRKWRRLLADESVVTRVVEVDGEVVGSVGCFEMEGEKEVTYWIRESWWGRGLATTALAALLAEVEERPVYGRVAADNVGSVKVLERNGFQRVGEEESFAPARGTIIRESLFRLDEPPARTPHAPPDDSPAAGS